jgi:hypothetical protein
VPHERGWRAQYARPLGFYELTVPPIARDGRYYVRASAGDVFVWDRRRHRSPLIDLAERYGVPRLVPPAIIREQIWPRTGSLIDPDRDRGGTAA